MKNNKLKSLTSDPSPVQTVRRELQKQRSNIKEVLRWSNATPIRRYGDMGYMCCWCEEQFPKPADLKNHTLESHRNLDNACFMKFNMDNLIVRLDITTLQCKICIKDLDSLDQLLKHLKTDHERPIYDIQNRITPLKFDTDMFQCCICHNIVSKFKVLLEHMHLHYRYYICKICDSGYACKRNLRLHMNGHKTGTFKCDHCSQIFDTVVKKKSHERSVHAQKRAYKCGYCHVTFTELKIKEAHLAAIHGVIMPKAECQVCLKVFDDRAQLNMHIRRDHLLERTHQCTECGKCFFYSTHLKRHMVKHTGVRAFKCNVCSKCFISTSSLKEHMKIHNNDKRFKCAHCGQAFVQKCSWKLHMRSKHQQIV